VLGWRGQPAVDSGGNKLGRIEEIYLDADTERPEWAPVSLGDEGLEIVLSEEQVVVTKRVVPRERVRVRTETLIEQRELSESLRRERVESPGGGIPDAVDARRVSGPGGEHEQLDLEVGRSSKGRQWHRDFRDSPCSSDSWRPGAHVH
jgi:hypothetical protein